MTAGELIAVLQSMPQDKEIRGVYDGAARLNVNIAYEAKGGYICLAEKTEQIYYTPDRPIFAPTAEQQKDWNLK